MFGREDLNPGLKLVVADHFDQDMVNPLPLLYEFHVAKKVRDKYDFDEQLFAICGNVLLVNSRAVRIFTQKINAQRDVIKHPQGCVREGQLNALGLIDEILHYITALYKKEYSANLFAEMLAGLEQEIGREALEQTLLAFVREFPATTVYRGEISAEAFLHARSKGELNKELVLEEILHLWLANQDKAFKPFKELFDDKNLRKQTAYDQIILYLNQFFKTKPRFGPDNQELTAMLRSPALFAPHSLKDQLEFIRERWGYLIGDYFFRLLGSMDLLQEEEKWGGAGPGPTRVLEFGDLEGEYERFSQDRDWMPQVVIMAKSTLVWLDQLSRKYQRSIKRLEEIPDEELDLLASYGFTGLWLIGLWERSSASRTIKRLCGNPEAEASAYSLKDYEIAGRLGGWDGLDNLRKRCQRRGLRLASDMVPNHTGLDSDWVLNHPDWFIQREHAPYPSYTFNGPNLSADPGRGVFLEDHYYDKTDAAVVFKWVDFQSGHERFIYHGNDGTSMPWNDTAQLDFLNSRVREAVIQTILHVARNFPIIRFDAAMVLAKKHIQRLWYPQPGHGGAIPSRSHHSMTDEEFHRAIPVEFWREVVDRIAKEVPDTLLLAEAFWFMEGYFVRTLGMHRVYNSAFMNMLKNEENSKYKQTIKNTLEFNPEILKRFVNFMNNPDEETAVQQFGKGDKYFGVTTLMVTMPGLPMFGHGQIEGYSEKYGMEYNRAQKEESPDPDLVRRHSKEIFPLLKKRYLFAEVRNFRFYDLYTHQGPVNDNVFAYTNSHGDEKVLVVYNNSFHETFGNIHWSTQYLKVEGNGERQLLSETLGQALGLKNDENYYCILIEQRSGLYYIRNCKEFFDYGLWVSLKGYEYQVFWGFYQVQDMGYYSRLCRKLNGRGVLDLDGALKELFLEPLHNSFRLVLNTESLGYFHDILYKGRKVDPGYNGILVEHYRSFLKTCAFTVNAQVEEELIIGEFQAASEAVLSLPSQLKPADSASSVYPELGLKGYLGRGLSILPETAFILLSWLITRYLGLIQFAGNELDSRSLLDEWLLGKQLSSFYSGLNPRPQTVARAIKAIKILNTHQHWYEKMKRKSPGAIFLALLKDVEVRDFIGENVSEGVLWFNKENYGDFVFWLLLIAYLELNQAKRNNREQEAKNLFAILKEWHSACEQSDFQVEKLIMFLDKA